MSKTRDIVFQIVNKSAALKDKYTDEVDADVEFACIFCQTDEEYEKYSKNVSKIGRIVQCSPSGYTYQLVKPVETKAGQLFFVKIRKPDVARKELGDADFNVNYHEFKRKHHEHPNFELIKREEFEMLRLSELKGDVMACFSNIPIRKLLDN